MHKHYKVWQARGLNQTQYCRENHVVLRQYRYWANKIEAELVSFIFKMPKLVFLEMIKESYHTIEGWLFTAFNF
ncbi:MAG: IS66 family insertion sequence element accessory protein TnpA [Mangrovibacterium sp.]